MAETAHPTFHDIMNLLEQSHTREVQEHTVRANHLQSQLADLTEQNAFLQNKLTISQQQAEQREAYLRACIKSFEDELRPFKEKAKAADEAESVHGSHNEPTASTSARCSPGQQLVSKALFEKLRGDYVKLFAQFQTLKDKYKTQKIAQVKQTNDGSGQLRGEKSSTDTPAWREHKEKAGTRKYEGSDEKGMGMGLSDTWRSGGESARTGDAAVVPVYAAAVTPDAAPRPTEPVVKEEPIESSGPCDIEPTAVATSSLSPRQHSSTPTHQASLPTPLLVPALAKQGVGLKLPKNRSRYIYKAVSSADVVKEVDGAVKGQEPVGGPGCDEVVASGKDAMEEMGGTKVKQEKEKEDEGKEGEGEREEEEKKKEDEETQPIASSVPDESEAYPVSQTFPSRLILLDNDDGEVKGMRREEAREGTSGLENDAKLEDNPFDVIPATASLSQITPFVRKLNGITIVPSSFDLDRTRVEMADERILSETGGWSGKYPRSIGALGDGVKEGRKISSPVEEEGRQTESDDGSIVYGTNPSFLSRHDDGNEAFWGVSTGNKRKTPEPDETERRMGNGEAGPSRMETPRRRNKWREEANERNSGEKRSEEPPLQPPSKVETPKRARTGTIVTTSANSIGNNSSHNKLLTPTIRSPTKSKPRSPFTGGTQSGSPTFPFIPPRRVNATPDTTVSIGMNSAESIAPFEDQPLRWKRHREVDARVTETPVEKVPKVLRVDERILGASSRGKQRDVDSHDDDWDWDSLLVMDTVKPTPRRDTRRGGNVMEAEAASARDWGRVATNAVDEQAGITSGLRRAGNKDGVQPWLPSDACDERSDLMDANELGSEAMGVRTTIVVSDEEDSGEGSRRIGRNGGARMIDSKKNGNVNYKYTEVVRKKDERSRMHGADCPCCRKFYVATGPLPPVDGHAPRFRSASSVGQNALPTDEDLLQQRMNQVSRHKYVHKPPPTPPGYWMVDFPDTQQVNKWNGDAREEKE